MKKTIITLIACSSVAIGSNVVKFDSVSGVKSKEIPLPNGDKVSLVLTASTFWVTSSTHSWKNQDALDIMNENMGLNYTLDNINGTEKEVTNPDTGETTTSWDGGINYTFTGGQNSTSDLTLTLIDDSLIGKDILIYALVTSEAQQLSHFEVSEGLSETSYRYATDDVSGFVSVETYSDSSGDYTMVEIKGTITDQSIVFNSDTQKNGWGMLAYKVIPEPTTATLSLLALAGLAARRRRR